MKCACNTECTDCVPGFQKIIDLKNVGLVIYRRSTEKRHVNNKTGNAVNTTEDIYILHNTKNIDISSADYWPEIGPNTINCPRCRKLLENAQNLLKNGPTIGGNDVTGICDHCKMKDKPCFECRQVVKRFVPGKLDRTEINKERIKHWFTKIGNLLQGQIIRHQIDDKKRAHSETHIDQLCYGPQRSVRKPDMEQLFEPLELDLDAISQPHIHSRLSGQNKDKKPAAHFLQLEKQETPIVFKYPLKRVVPSTSAVFEDDEILSERSNFRNVRSILKPERKILPSHHSLASSVQFNSETFGMKESIESFEHIFIDRLSVTPQQAANICRNITKSDEIIGFKPNETKHASKHVISEKVDELSTRQRKTKSVQSLEMEKENMIDSKPKELERAALIRKYHSTETLVIKIHGITEDNLKQANRIIFPKEHSIKLTKQKSSSELITEQTQQSEKDADTKMHEKGDYKSKGAENAERDDYISEKGTKITTKGAQKAEKDSYPFEKSSKKSIKNAPIAEKNAHKFEKSDQKSLKDAQKSEKDDHKLIYEKSSKISIKNAPITEKDAHKFEKSDQKSLKDAQKSEKVDHKLIYQKSSKMSIKNAPIAEKDAHKFEKSDQKSLKDAQKSEKDAHKFEEGVQKSLKDTQKARHTSFKKSTKDAQIAENDGYTSQKGAKKSTKNAKFSEKDTHKYEKDAQKTPKDAQKDGYTFEKGGKGPIKDAEIAVKLTHKVEKVAQKTATDAQKAKNYAEISSQKDEEHAQKAELRGQKTNKKFLKSQRDVEKKLQNEDQKIIMEADDLEKDKLLSLKKKNRTEVEKQKKTDLPKTEVEKQKKTDLPETEVEKQKKTDLPKTEVEKQKKTDLPETEVEKQKKTDLPKTQGLNEKKRSSLELKAEKEKVDARKSEDKTELDARSFKKSISHDLLRIQSIKMKRPSTETDDLILKLVEIRQSTWDGSRTRLNNLETEVIPDMRLPMKVPTNRIIVYPSPPETCIVWSDSEIEEIKLPQITDVIIGSQICKIRPLNLHDDSEVMPPLLKFDLDSSRKDKKQEIALTPGKPKTKEMPPILKSDLDSSRKNKKQEIALNPGKPKTKEMPPLLKFDLDSSRKDKKQEIALTPEKPKTKEPIRKTVNEKHETTVTTEIASTNKAMNRIPLLTPGNLAAGTTSKGYVRYTLSDRKFIDNGWTLLPTEKVVRKMNVYRMRPARPEFDWFEHNKNKRLMEYDTGEKLAEFDENGRGRWFYRNGRMALDYYDAEELNAGQRFVIYSNGEPDERGRSRPYTLLATFDFSGNGIVFDHRGKIRLKYNQTEGVVLDRSIGPVSHWKWHTLNDPPVLQQVMIDTQIAHKDPKIMKLGTPNDNKPRKDNEEMLAIEFDNFVKEKSKKLSQAFKPFQIKMKALKINEHFSLRVLDQATVYLLYRDGTTNLKLNIGMLLDQKEIVDTDTAEVGEVSSSMEKLPARTESLAGLQKSVAHAQNYDSKRTERDRKMHPAEPNASVDKLVAGISRPSRPPPRPVLSQSTSLTTAEHCKCTRKPTSTSVYYDTRFY